MGNPIKHNYKCKSKKPCLIVTKRGDNLCEIQNQEPENCDLSCKPCKPCLKVTKKGNDLVELQHPEHSEESSSECENVCEKPCFVVVKNISYYAMIMNAMIYMLFNIVKVTHVINKFNYKTYILIYLIRQT